MKYWEFLIQREGDQTWLPLAAQQAEILAGRYRVAAHTDRVNAPLEIRVSQLITGEMPPHRQVRKRTGETNESGIVMVVPYVTFQPGQWELTCSSLNVMDDLMGDGWQYGLQLQVLPAAEDGQAGRQSNPADLATAVNGADLEANTAVNEDLPLMQAQAHLLNGSGQGHVANANAAPADGLTGPGYRVSLKQLAYLAQQDQPLTIVGKVDSLLEQKQEITSQLWICLQDPQTEQVIMEAHRPLSLAHLPADFKVQIQLPAEVTTRLLWGEVSLRAAAANPADRRSVLTSTAFTITAGIDRLLEAIASQESGTFDEEVSVNGSPHSLLNQNGASPSSATALEPTQRPVATAVDAVLPDDEARSPDQSLHPQPELPSFASPAAAPPVAHNSHPSMVSQPAQFVGTSIENDDLEADEIAAVLEDIDQDLHLEDSDLDAFEPPELTVDLPADPPADLPPDQRAVVPENRKSPRQAKAHVAFQSLKLKDHFWQRLSALTHESHQEAAKVAKGMEAAGLSRERASNLPAVSEFSLDDEVVIYDQPPAATRSTFTPPPVAPTADQQASPVQPAEPIEWPDQTAAQPSRTPGQPSRQVIAGQTVGAELPEMALPVISVPMKDLVAGETVTVVVRTRPSAYRPFIRLWMIDRQSRSLVGEPQTLTNLLPDALGDLQSGAELQVPMDCLDVQIAAIAVDMATRQESGKAVVNRRVVPASQSPSSSFRL